MIPIRLAFESSFGVLRASHGARNARVFGSVARGDADEKSDIDLLEEFEPGRSLQDHAGLWLEPGSSLP